MVDSIDNINLVSKFDKDELKRLGEECCELYQSDDESRSEWLEMHTRYLEIYHQTDTYDSNFGDGFTGSDARVPLLTESCLSFQARGYKAIFPQRSFVATSSMEDITPEEEQRADRISKWMNYYLNFRYRRYKRDKKRMLLATALMGSDFTKTYYDPITGLPIVERVRAQDFIVSYGTGPRELKDVRRKTHRIVMDINKAKKLYQTRFFEEEPEKADAYREDNQLKSIEDQAEGMTKPAEELNVAIILEQHTFYDLDGDGIEEPVIIWIDETSEKVLRITARYDLEDETKEPIEYFTHYYFIDNTDGFYGFGYGHLIGYLNQALNQMVRNSIDAGELANSGNMSGFISEALGVKGGEVEFPIGRFAKIPRSVGDLRNSIYQMQFPGPNGAYVTLMEFMQGIIQRLANTTEAVSGDVSKVYQPMTILTMLEQSLQLPTSIMEGIALAMEDELDKIYNCASRNAPSLETFVMEDQRISISEDDFKGALRIYPILDPRSITKQQKMAKAQSVYQLAATNPLIANDPNAMYEITRDVLESMEVEDIDSKLPKPQQPKIERIDNQYEENMYFLLPPQDRPLFDVFPDQDHAAHIKIINDLLNGEKINLEQGGEPQIPEESLQAILIHKQKHTAYLYGTMKGVIDGQGQLGAMETEARDAALLEALGDVLSMGGESIGLPTGESGTVPGTGGGFEGSGEISGEGLLRRVPLTEE